MIDLFGIILIIGATWLVSDGVYSITLYLNAPSYVGSSKQTWKGDHWVRLVRIFIALIVITIGVMLIIG